MNENRIKTWGKLVLPKGYYIEKYKTSCDTHYLLWKGSILIAEWYPHPSNQWALRRKVEATDETRDVYREFCCHSPKDVGLNERRRGIR